MFCAQDGTENFFHPSKTDKADIIYIVSNEHGRKIPRTVAVDSRTSLNTLDYLPVVGTLNLPVISRDEKKHTTRIMCKARWEKCDRALTNCQLERICYFDTFLPSLNGSIDILEPLGHLNAVLKRATLLTVCCIRALLYDSITVTLRLSHGFSLKCTGCNKSCIGAVTQSSPMCTKTHRIVTNTLRRETSTKS